MTAQCLTRGRQGITIQSPHFITVGRRRALTEEQTQRRHSNRRKNVGTSPTFNGWWDTRTRRRYLSTCIFSLSDYNRLGPESASYRQPDTLSTLSDSANESAHQQCELMTHQRDSCTIYTTTDASIIEQRTPPTECPACDSPNTTIEGDIWHCGHCGASGLLGGERA
jgi:hypothetical protein